MGKGQLLRHLAGESERGRYLRKVVGYFFGVRYLVEPAVDLDGIVLLRVFAQVGSCAPLGLGIDQAYPARLVLRAAAEADLGEHMVSLYKEEHQKIACLWCSMHLFFVLDATSHPARMKEHTPS